MKFLKIKNQTTGSNGIEKAELYFYGDIVSDSWQSFWTDEDKCPEDIRDFLNGIDENAELNIYINSGGGSVFGGLAIYNMLKRHKGYKRVYIDGIAASIASVIALAGDRVVIPSNSFFMIHKPSGMCCGNADEMREYADILDNIQTSIMNVYKDHLCDGVDPQEIESMINAETWLNGEEATKYFKMEMTVSNESVASASQLYKNYANTPGCFRENEIKNSHAKLEQEKNKLLLELELA